MKRTDLARVVLLVSAIGLIAGCSGESVRTEAEPAAAEPVVEKADFPDPRPMVADKVKEAVSGWVAERASEEGVFDVPPRGGQDVTGTMGEFHTVHQNDADTYTVCVDFADGDNTYDVDFFVDRTAEGLIVRDVYLHKINGETVSG
jgi:hypothetical protein